ncbi:BEN domain-containing protein 5 [Rhipicephalus sanguineus]|uniref:BEN domain-containing protein 5 n=1 Tax=Rhipicephalus sanguineus TaxID=34632 RepID=UPI00189412E9|nr:BEN domain-containing protein 5 [Rhipicephalus sanguineus]
MEAFQKDEKRLRRTASTSVKRAANSKEKDRLRNIEQELALLKNSSDVVNCQNCQANQKKIEELETLNKDLQKGLIQKIFSTGDLDLGSSQAEHCDSEVELCSSQGELGSSQGELDSSQGELSGSQGELGDPNNGPDGSQWDQYRFVDQTVIGSSRDDGKIYAGCNRWVDKDAWAMLMRSPSDSMFCRSACLIYWTPEQLKCRSVTGVLSNKYGSLGQTQAKPAMTPEKLNALKAVFHVYMGDNTPADVADKRVKSVRRHLAQKLGDVQRKYVP